jgi:hypothetical protein
MDLQTVHARRPPCDPWPVAPCYAGDTVPNKRTPHALASCRFALRTPISLIWAVSPQSVRYIRHRAKRKTPTSRLAEWDQGLGGYFRDFLAITTGSD